MAHPWGAQQIAREHRRQLLEAAAHRRLCHTEAMRGHRRRAVRERVGWKLVGLGARLALPGAASTTVTE